MDGGEGIAKGAEEAARDGKKDGERCRRKGEVTEVWRVVVKDSEVDRETYMRISRVRTVELMDMAP